MSARTVHCTVHHGRVALALHRLREAGGPRSPRLLLLHALGGSSADWSTRSSALEAWPGEVWALDFSGHGDSEWLEGRGYSPEGFAAEADAAIAALDEDEDGKKPVPLHLAGAGIGAYVALLLAGARPDQVQGALLLPGAGLAGGGHLPFEQILSPAEREGVAAEFRVFAATPPRACAEAPPDPMVVRCERDLRPVYYAEEFARAARRLLIPSPAAPHEREPMPPWLEAAARQPSAASAPGELASALRALVGC